MNAPAPIKALALAALLLLVGGAILQGARPDGRSDPVASVDNGGPRGLLLWGLLLDRAGVNRRTWYLDDDVVTTMNTTMAKKLVIVVPPPERTKMLPKEAEGLLALARAGAHIVVFCDGSKDRNDRLVTLLAPLGLRCDVDVDAPARTAAMVPGVPGPITIRDGVSLRLDPEKAGLLALSIGDNPLIADPAPVLARATVEAGDLTVVASVSVVANDGLVPADPERQSGASSAHLAFASWLLLGGGGNVDGDLVVVFDERHHLTRSKAVFMKALTEGPGAKVALACLLLLIPLSLLGLSPRKGELLDAGDGIDTSTSPDRVTALAALMARAGLPSSTASASASASSSPSSSSTLSSSRAAPPASSSGHS